MYTDGALFLFHMSAACLYLHHVGKRFINIGTKPSSRSRDVFSYQLCKNQKDRSCVDVGACSRFSFRAGGDCAHLDGLAQGRCAGEHAVIDLVPGARPLGQVHLHAQRCKSQVSSDVYSCLRTERLYEIV